MQRLQTVAIAECRFAHLATLLLATLTAVSVDTQSLDLTVAHALDSLPGGTPVRVYPVHASPSSVTGLFIRFDSARLVITTDRSPAREISWHVNDIDRVDKLGERTGGWAFARGAGIGALVGLSIGVVSTIYAAHNDRKNGCGDCFISAPVVTAVPTVPLVGVTSLVGGLIGLGNRKIWRAVPIPVAR